MLTDEQIKEHDLIVNVDGDLELRNMLSVSPAFLEFMCKKGYFVYSIDSPYWLRPHKDRTTITTTFRLMEKVMPNV